MINYGQHETNYMIYIFIGSRNKNNMGECKIMMVSHDALVAMQTRKNNNLLNLRDYSRYFYNQFEYGVKI
jgi:hypothetical protein